MCMQTQLASHGSRCYCWKVCVSVTSLRRSMRYFTAHLFYQSTPVYIKGKINAARAQSRRAC